MPTRNSNTTTLRLLPGTDAWTLPTVEGHWKRDPDGAVVARYDRGDGDGGDELAAALEVWAVLYGGADEEMIG